MSLRRTDDDGWGRTEVAILILMAVILATMPMAVDADLETYYFTDEDLVYGSSTGNANRNASDGSFQVLTEADIVDTNFSASSETVTTGSAGGSAFPSSLNTSDDSRRSYAEASTSTASYVVYLHPTSDATKEWDIQYPATPTTHFDKVDDADGTGDGLSTYVRSATYNDQDDYNMGDMAEPAAGYNINVAAWCIYYKNSSLASNIKFGIQQGSSEREGYSGDLEYNTWFNRSSSTWTVDPTDSIEWTYAEVNALKTYIKSSDVSPSPHVTDLGIVVWVNYTANYALNATITLDSVASESYTDHYDLLVEGYRSGSENFGVYVFNWTNASWGLKDVIDQGSDTDFSVPLTSYERNASNQVKVRFKGLTETGDSTQDTLYLDMLKVQRTDTWFRSQVEFTTDAEVATDGVLQLTSRGYTSDAEAWTLEVWNATEAAWDTAATLTAQSNTWCNYTINAVDHVDEAVVLARWSNIASDANRSILYLDILVVSRTYSTAANTAPEITSSPVLTGTVLIAYSYHATATDADGDTPLYWSIDTNASFLSVHLTQGYVNGTPTEEGWFWVNVTVADGNITGGNLTDSQNYTLTISGNLAPYITSITSGWVEVEGYFSYLVTAEDPNDDELTILMETDAGWLYLDGWWVNGTAAEAGTYYLNITVTDGSLSDTQNLSVVVYIPSEPGLTQSQLAYLSVVISLVFGIFSLAVGYFRKMPALIMFSGIVWMFSAVAVYESLSIGWMILSLGLGMVFLISGSWLYVQGKQSD